jgi:hypothetical protein
MHGARLTARRVVRAMAMLAIVIILLALLGAAVMLLWNWLVPALFRGPTLQYWQAVGLLILSRLLFGGLRGHGHWRQRRWRERWEQLTPEEREQLRQRYVSRCGHRDQTAGPAQPPQG